MNFSFLLDKMYACVTFLDFCSLDKCLGMFVLHFFYCEAEQLFICIKGYFLCCCYLSLTHFLLGDWSFSYTFQGALYMLEISAFCNMNGIFPINFYLTLFILVFCYGLSDSDVAEYVNL